jgi:hypothetical protein
MPPQPQFYYSPNPQPVPPPGMQAVPQPYMPGIQIPQYQPRHRSYPSRRRRHRSKDDSTDADSSDSDKESVQPEYEDTIEAHEHYTVRFQRWHVKKNIYVPFDSRNWTPEPIVEKNTDTYFFVNCRHYIPGGKPETLDATYYVLKKHCTVEPQLYLSDWSDPLLYFLRFASDPPVNFDRFDVGYP